MKNQKMSVLLTTEGTFPYFQGGVSTWCDMLIKGLPNIHFTILSILPDPFVTQKYSLPKGSKMIRIPLWGTDEPSEHLDLPFSSTYLSKARTSIDVLQEKFIPIFDDFIREILAREKDSVKMGMLLLQLYEFFREYDYKAAFKSELTWERYKVLVKEEVARPESGFETPDLYSLIQSLGWLYRFFNVVNTHIPHTHIVHSTASAFCGIPCVIAKLKYGVPYLLTEHGVYLREQYLSLSKHGYSSFLNTFLIRMIWSVTDLNYHFADQISPVCQYNTRWEKRLTSRVERFRVIYNGVDSRVFERIEPRLRDRPTVVTVARIDPIKDLFTLIKVAGEVRQAIPQVKFLVYGSISVPSYYDECMALIKKLSLDSVITFQGHTNDMVSVYDQADLVLQTSISEAFPYSIVESMFAGKCTVATDVGGTAEAIGNAGILVNPGDVQGLARTIVSLFQNTQQRLELGEEARLRAYDLFTVGNFLSEYMRSYIRLAVLASGKLMRQRAPSRRGNVVGLVGAASGMSKKTDTKRTGRASRQLQMERALALLSLGYPELAAAYLRRSVRAQAPQIADLVKQEILVSLYERLKQDAPLADARKTRHRIKLMVDQSRQQLLAERAAALDAHDATTRAIHNLERALEADPNSSAIPFLMIELGRLYSKERQEDKAREYLTKAYLACHLAQ